MNNRDSFTGQCVNSQNRNDNAPPRYSPPSAKFTQILASYANPYCSNCGGTGYIGRFKHVCAGRCFKCIPDRALAQAEAEFNLACQARTGSEEMAEIYLAICGSGSGGVGPACLSDGMWITPDGEIYDAADSSESGSKGSSAAFRMTCFTA